MLKNISEIKPNPQNPRTIEDHKFKLLVKSIKAFPEMLELRPIVVDEDLQVLGGNMRLRACKEAGLKKVNVSIAKGLSEEQKKEFIIKDNVGFGQWDWELLSTDTMWNELKLDEWGLDFWQENIENITEVNEGDENSEWVDMPDFEKGQGYIQCNIIFATEDERENFINENLIQYKTILRNKQKIVYFGTPAK